MGLWGLCIKELAFQLSMTKSLSVNIVIGSSVLLHVPQWTVRTSKVKQCILDLITRI